MTEGPTEAAPRVAARASLRRRWWRGFALMLALSLLSGVVSVAVVVHLAGSLRRAAAQGDRESSLMIALRTTINDEDALAHQVVDRGSVVAGAFLGVDARVTQLLEQARATYKDPAELALVDEVDAAREDAWGLMRPVAADPQWADAFGHQLADKDGFHGSLLPKRQFMETKLAELDALARTAVHGQIADADRAERWLIALLGTLFVLSAGLTVVLARRLSREVIAPIRQIVESTDHFAEGRLDHRIAIDSRDEFGHLAERFNAMAAALAANQQHLTTQAHYDNLTGLLNRARFLERVDDAIERAKGTSNAVWIGFIDLDDFKVINDSRGHDAGDEVLRQVANLLLSTTRPSDVVARLGGDEFAILLGPGTDESGAELIAQRIVDALAEPLWVFGEDHQIGASIGVACKTDATLSTDDLIRRADVAMYTAKGRGKNCWECYDAAVHGHLTERRIVSLRRPIG